MFLNILSNVVIILIYMLLGFVLCKTRAIHASHAKSFSALLLYVLSPAMILNAFIQIEYAEGSVLKFGVFFAVTFAVQALFLLLLYVLFKKNYSDARYRILSVGATLGNVGFFGIPVISSIFPGNELVVCYSSMNVVSMNILVFTIGVFMITNERRYVSWKNAVMNPTTLALLAALPLFLLRVRILDVIASPVSVLAKMVTPMCMIILGMRLSTVEMRQLFRRPFVYLTCLFKLAVFPAFAFLCVRFLPFMDDTAKASVFILAATPAGAIIQTLAELHECEQELAANVVLLTTIASLVTMPVVVTALLELL